MTSSSHNTAVQKYRIGNFCCDKNVVGNFVGNFVVFCCFVGDDINVSRPEHCRRHCLLRVALLLLWHNVCIRHTVDDRHVWRNLNLWHNLFLVFEFLDFETPRRRWGWRQWPGGWGTTRRRRPPRRVDPASDRARDGRHATSHFRCLKKINQINGSLKLRCLHFIFNVLILVWSTNVSTVEAT